MTVLVQAIRQQISIETIDIDTILYKAGVGILKFGFKLIGQMILTLIASLWLALSIIGWILSSLS